MREIVENLQDHIATYADARAVIYTLNSDTGGRMAKIVLDLVWTKDIGIAQATSSLIGWAISSGIKLENYKVHKYITD